MKRPLSLLFALTACREPAPSEPTPQSQVERRGEPHESDAWSIRLTPEATAALGIKTDTVGPASSDRTRIVGGFVITPPGSSAIVTAPLAGILHAGDVPLDAGTRVSAGDVLLRLTPFAPVDRDLRAQAQRQRAGTRTRLELAEVRVQRTRKLLVGRATSQRLLDEARAELAIAKGEDRAARAREQAFQRAPLDADVSLELKAPHAGLLRKVNASAEQAVASAAALFEVVRDDQMWLRVSIYAGDVERVSKDQPVRVARLGTEFSSIVAHSITAPPSADPLSAGVDLYYGLSSPEFHRPGERVLVELHYPTQERATSVPSSALVLDVDGGTWVWECLPQGAFRRRRVEVIRHSEGRALLARGPALGSCVVSIGALELLGAEFGVQH